MASWHETRPLFPRRCPFCGSTACEWDRGTFLGCEDCGYDALEDPDALGPCGCIDYHMADCPTVTDRFGD
jgi:hypothetical protein